MRMRAAPLQMKICSVCSVTPDESLFWTATPVKSWTGVASGDYVVHQVYGIGIYRGLQATGFEPVGQRKLVIEYAQGAMVYVSEDWGKRVRLYAGQDKPQVTRFGEIKKGIVLYEGTQCPHCHTDFDESTDRQTYADRLILVGQDAPSYGIFEACNCPACGNVYNILFDTLDRKSRCRKCGERLMPEEVFEAVTNGYNTNLQRATALTRLLNGIKNCPQKGCGEPTSTICWCPLCTSDESKRKRTCLPRQLLKLWQITGLSAQSSSDLPEYLEPGENDPGIDGITG